MLSCVRVKTNPYSVPAPVGTYVEAVAACRQKRRVRSTTAAALVHELIEAKHAMQLARVLARYARYDVIAIDEVGYVPLADVGAELLFQITDACAAA